MIVSLSIVLDKDKKVRLDLIQNRKLSEIDQYTTQFVFSDEIRNQFQEEIKQFLLQNQELIQTFQNNSNKQGNLVIIYSDEHSRLHRMRVFYQENKQKTDFDFLLKKVCDVIRGEADPSFTIQLMRNFSFFLGSPFDIKEIEKVEKSWNDSIKARRNHNQRLLNMIRNHILYASNQDFEKGYFYLRLIDAYLERNGLFTTKRNIPLKTGTLHMAHTCDTTSILQKKSGYQQVLVEKAESFFLEEDGQYAFFDLGSSKGSFLPSFNESQYYKYEHFLENSEDIEGQLTLKL